MYRNGIDLTCGLGETGKRVPCEVKLTFQWPSYPSLSQEWRSALLFLDCSSNLPPTARMTFTSSGATLDGCSGTGSASGILNTNATGPLATTTPIAFSCAGLSGSIRMNVNITEGWIAGGYHDAYCFQSGCVRCEIVGA